jgi:hypothetical protein
MTRRWVLTILCGTWTIAFWLALHGGLALVVDHKSGAKYCIDRLALYLGLDQGSVPAAAFTAVSVLLTLALPFLIVGIIVVPHIIRWRARGK